MFSHILCVLVAVALASCGQSGGKKTEKYVKAENGYALERFEGTSVDKTFTVKDEIDGEPVTELMKFSIANAEYLEEINIGKNVEKIDTWALANCGKLKAINVDKENPYFCSVDGVLFTKDMKTLLAYPNSSHGVTYDKTGAFSSLGSYTVPDTVEFIEDHAFYKCNGLGKIVFPSNLKDIGVRAFTNGFATIFGMILTPFSTVMAMLIPFLYTKIGFTTDWDILYEAAIRNEVINITLLVAAVAGVLTAIPYFFYDLSIDKHRKIIEELKIRAEKEDMENAKSTDIMIER